MNSSSTILGIKKIQDAFKVLAMLQMTAHLWPQHADVKDGASFDYIIIGGGTAGSVIANRLTEIEDVTVLLIEAGGDPPVESIFPGLLALLKNSDVDWQHTTENDNYSQQFHKNYGVELTRGKMLGGSSSMNFMAYTRGHGKVYDDWARIAQDYSWSWSNVLPYFMKSEKLVDPIILNSPDSFFHGTDGYMKVGKLKDEEAIDYLEAFGEIGHSVPIDTNGNHPLGYTECMVSMADGKRQSTAYSFLRPIKDRPNFFVLKHTLATKILFDEYRNAIGVEVLTNDDKKVQYRAAREVILSAGAINTPQLLMLSGIGPAEHLRDIGIEVFSDLPVGQSLMDHVMVIINNAINKAPTNRTSDPTVYPFPMIMGYSALDTNQDYPDYQSINILLNEPSKILNFCSFYYSFIDEVCDDLYNRSLGKQILLTMLVHINAKSRGKILLRSSDPRDKPLVYTGYYSDNRDLDNHAKYLKDFMRVYDTKLFNSTEAEFVVPEVCGCGNPTETNERDNELCHIQDQEFWKCYTLCMMVSGYHYAGSCPMGTVVDSRLNLYGVRRLRIADASVMPKMPGANINAAVIMIGEKAADMIKEDYYFGYLDTDFKMFS